jgi:hypothetical protein
MFNNDVLANHTELQPKISCPQTIVPCQIAPQWFGPAKCRLFFQTVNEVFHPCLYRPRQIVQFSLGDQAEAYYCWIVTRYDKKVKTLMTKLNAEKRTIIGKGV